MQSVLFWRCFACASEHRPKISMVKISSISGCEFEASMVRIGCRTIWMSVFRVSLFRTRLLAHARTLAHTRSLARTDARTHARALARARAHTHTPSYTHTHTHTPSLVPGISVLRYPDDPKRKNVGSGVCVFAYVCRGVGCRLDV